MTWNTVRLGDVLTLKRGYDLPASERGAGLVPVVSSSGITGYHHEAKVAGPGVVTGRYGTLGEVYFIAEDFWPLNTSLYVQDFKGNSPRFIAYFLRHILRGLTSDKAAVPGVNRNDLHAREIVFPHDSGVQVSIVDILSKYDNLIENNRRRIELLEQAARLLYKEWFVHFRFPGHEHVKIVDGVPEGWKTTKLANVAQINSLTIPSNYDGEVEYVDISSVTTGSVNETTRYNFKDAPSRARRVVKHKDIIWSCVRPNRKSFALVMYPADNLVVSTGFAVISPFDFSSFLYHAITTEEFVKYLSNNARGAAYPAVTASDFEKAEIILPSKNVLIEFCGIVDPIMEQIHTLHKLSKKLVQARDLLLPRLMNGEITI